VLLAILSRFMKLSKHKIVAKLAKKLEDLIFYTLLVRLVLESYLELMISSFLNSSHVSLTVNF